MDINKQKILEQKSQLSAAKQELLEKRLRREIKSDSQFQAIPRHSNNNSAPLSFGQQQLWFIDQLQPNNSAYNESLAICLKGQLNIVSLHQSLNEIVRRHEILRTTFTVESDQPVQVIAPSLNIALPLVDLRSLSPDDRETKVQQIATAEAGKPFDLAIGSLWRCTLLQLDEAENILLLTIHHIIFDGWSVGIIFRELSQIYTAFTIGKPSLLPELPIQYADFSIWQRQWLQGEVLEKLLSYWKQQLNSAPPVLQLPTDFPRPRIQNFHGATESFSLSPDLTEKLKNLSQQEGVTLFMILLAAFQTLLYRYTGQSDIVVGSPVANRNRKEVKELIGFFANTLALRTHVAGDISFRELLGRVRECTLSAYAHQELPFERLVEELQPERNLSYNPLIQVMFILENTPTEALKLPNLSVSHLVPENAIAKLDLSLNIYETLNIYGNSLGLTGVVRYNTDLFTSATISRMVGHFLTLLSGIVNHPDEIVSHLPLLTVAEKHQLLVEWNNTQTDYLQDKYFHQLFAAQAERVPDAVAFVFQDQQLTYRELNRRANQLAHYLQAQGVRPEVLVGIYVERSLEMIVAVLGIFKAGGAYVPLDPTYPPERIAFMLSDSQVPIILTTENLVTKLPEHQAQVIYLDRDWAKISQQSHQTPETSLQIQNLAYLIYTSGSTGKPKGVLVTHEGLVNLTEDKIRTCRVQQDSRILQFFSLSFDASIPEIVMALGSGATLYLGTPESLLPGTGLTQLLRQQAITHITIIPSALATLSHKELPDLQMVLVGGEACSAELIEQWSKGRLFINAYGPTETTVNASMVECGNSGQKLPTLRPAANKQLYILDQNLQLVPIGVLGELHIGGIGLARGYLNRPEKTAEVFIRNPFSNQPDSRLYKTGDLACYLPDGNIKLLGRLDHQVKIRGFRIELGEIEALLSQHPEVQHCVVIVREDNPGDKRLVAYIVPTTDSTATISDLRQFIAEQLPEYMVPAVFVILEALPLNPSGKVDRQALPAPGTTRPELESDFVAPRTPTEKALADIWAELLNLEQIGIHDNFFDLGGDSILSTRFIAKANQVGLEFTTKQLFEHQTIAELATVADVVFPVQQMQSPLNPIQPSSALVALQPHGSRPPIFFAHGLGGTVICYYQLTRHLGTDQPFYALQSPGVDGEREPHTRIQDMAAEYIGAMRSIQPNGPYFLGGWSMGAFVAFEIAQQLQNQGQEVAFLAILSQEKVLTNRYSDDGDDAKMLAQLFKDLAGSVGQDYSISYEHLRQLQPEEQHQYVLEQMKLTNLLPEDLEFKQFRNYMGVVKGNIKATANYIPQVSKNQMPLLLFRTKDNLTNNIDDPTLGWYELVSEKVEVHDIPGDHLTLLSEPHVQVLAEHLKPYLHYNQ